MNNNTSQNLVEHIIQPLKPIFLVVAQDYKHDYNIEHNKEKSGTNGISSKKCQKLEGNKTKRGVPHIHM